MNKKKKYSESGEFEGDITGPISEAQVQ